jgi:thiamine-phosphate pyrophosphorylase
MGWSVTPCFAWQLYVVADPNTVGVRDLVEVVAGAVRGGADVIQLRDKIANTRRLIDEARRLLPITRAAGVPLIINDRVDVAQAVGADGVHLGQDDLPIAKARHMLAEGCFIGQSTHSLDEALSAKRDGADYIGFGPIFQTPTKPDYVSVGTGLISKVIAQAGIPVVCIGGIDLETVSDVIEAGARCIAVVRAVCSAEDSESATRNLKEIMTAQTHRPKLSPPL